MRLAGVVIPTEKRVLIAIQYVYGIGPTRAEAICKKAKIKDTVRVKDLTPEQEDAIRNAASEFVLESDLRRQVTQDIKRLQDVGSYRGFRHRRRLPVRGQRSKTNARTRKGKKSGPIANKKKVAK